MDRFAFVDDVAYAKEFRTGDLVRKSNIRDLIVTPFVGRVLYSNTATGKVSVQWPWGQEIESPTELVKAHTTDVGFDNFDTSLSTWESARYKSVDEKSDAKWRNGLASLIVDEFEK
jgi:hypothetical protein